MPSTVPPLPSVILTGRPIEPAVLKYVPKAVMEKYQVAAFEVTDVALRLAVVFPEQLKQGFYVALEDLGKKLGKKVELSKTDAASLKYLLSLYPAAAESATAPPYAAQPVPQLPPTPAPAPAPATPAPPAAPPEPVPQATARPAREIPPPPLFKLGRTVAFNYLKRVPLKYAREQRLVSVDFLPPSTYWFVTDRPDSPERAKVLGFIEENNGITVHPLVIGKSELDELVEYYADLAGKEDRERESDEEDRRKAEEKIRREEDRAAMADSAQALEPLPERKVAEGVTAVDSQAEILSTQEEKGGIAGLFQKLGHLNEKEPEAAAEKREPEKPKFAAPDTGASSRSAAEPVEVTAPENSRPAASKAPIDDENADIGKLLDKQVENLDELKGIIKKGMIPHIVAAVVSYAINEKASDIHVEAFDDEVRIRYRVDGQLLDVVKLPPDLHAAMVSRIKILSRLRLDETRVPQDGRFDVNFGDTQVDLRVSVMPTVHGEKVVMRILDKSRGITSLEKLGIEGLGYQRLTEAIQKPFGVVLATGPTGSGKSTSLYAILNRIATPNVNVVTLEDPVEYEMKGINQAQIRPKIGFTFAEGLRSVLRQDPNIIMVGEIRDGETANMATQAALTGHLVLSTLHTNDAAGAIPRLTNMGIEPFLITSSLNVAIGQRLVRKICPDCKKEISLPPGFKADIERQLAEIELLNPLDAKRIAKPYAFYQGMGCDKCSGKGYRGRLGIYEVLTMTDRIEELTLGRSSNTLIQEEARKDGMLSMYQDGLIKVVNGVTTLDEVLRETSNK